MKICIAQVVYRFYCMALFYSQTQLRMINGVISLPDETLYDKCGYQMHVHELWLNEKDCQIVSF